VASAAQRGAGAARGGSGAAEGGGGGEAVPLAALATAAAATLLGASWLREPGVSYLAGALVATAAALGLGWQARRARGWLVAFAAAALAFAIPATWTQRTLSGVERDWPRTRAEHTRAAEQAIARGIAGSVAALDDVAAAAVRAPAAPAAAFDALEQGLPRGAGERAVVLVEGGRPVGWAGTLRVPVESIAAGIGVSITPFHVVLHATATSGARTAIATELLHAAPPASDLARAADRTLLARADGWTFDFARPTARLDSSWRIVSWRGAPVVAVQAQAPALEAVRTRAVQQGSAQAAPAVGLLVLLLVAMAWRRDRPAPRWLLARRLAALLVPLAAIDLVPLSSLSNSTRLFDPAVFYAPRGGHFAGSIGALALTSIVLVVGTFALLRSARRLRSRWIAAAIVVAVAVVEPYLLRELSRGIAPPPFGASVRLWIGWQVALFLPAVAMLIAGATAGRVAIGRWRGLPPLVAPAIAGVVALVGPLLWGVPAGWPAWYPLLWSGAAVALALTRAMRRLVFVAATVAGLGASTLVWSVVATKRVELAVQDVQELTTPDPNAERWLERFASELAAGPPPTTAADLLRRYAESSLHDADYPVTMTSWLPAGSRDTIGVEVATDAAAADSAGVRALVVSARQSGGATVATMRGDPGVATVIALPHPGGRVTTVAVFPRSRMLPESPLAALLGLRRPSSSEPPYSVVVERERRVAPGGAVAPRFAREGNEVHGDWNVLTSDGWAHAHVEIELRPLDVLAQRAALFVLLDALIVGVLWTLPAAADGAVNRRIRVWRAAWGRSYRARLTVALFTFFVVPAATFAIWSYRQLQSTDRQSRELLVRETLRAAAAGAPEATRPELAELAGRLGTPLLVYDGGRLARASNPLLFDLAPIGLLLPRQPMLDIVLGNEVTAAWPLDIGPDAPLFGFRYAAGPAGQRLVVAAPARNDDVPLEQRRRDLAVLVTLVVAGGALAALWLSGLAASELARPVGALRRAALAIAAGEREPGLGVEPPAEFRPVFAAFRRMAADLSESRSELEAAQRRTAAVLRNVASGVLAVGREGRVTIANPRAELLLQTALPPGAPLGTLCPESLAERVAGFLGGDGAPGAPADEEFDLELHGRQLRARLTRLASGRAADGGAAVLTLDDLTDLARAQRVLAWGEMARQVAHEIKNPLTPIRLGVQHLRRAFRDRRGNFEEILERNVERVLAEIDRLDEIARSFSRYGSAPGQRAPGVPTDVAAVSRDVVALERLGQSAVAWEIDAAQRPVLAFAREDELREVLLNLLENARHAHATAVRVAVTTEAEEVTILIGDDGEGIPADLQARVFEPHFSTRTSGSGLGLAISRRLIDGWGGRISLESTPGVGTTVTLALRAAANGDGAAVEPSARASDAPSLA